MELETDEVLAHMSGRGKVEWELAVEKAKNARLVEACRQLMSKIPAQEAERDDGSE